MTPEETAWLAGILEGEGCFYSSGPHKGRMYPALRLVMVDRDVVERVAELVGANVRHVESRSERHQDVYELTLTGWPAIDVMTAVRPFLGIRRGAKVDELTRNYDGERRDGRTHCHAGHDYTPENTYVYPDGSRQCVACRREYGGFKADRGPGGRYPELHQPEWLRERIECLSVREIADELGCSLASVSAALRRNGIINRRGPGRRPARQQEEVHA